MKKIVLVVVVVSIIIVAGCLFVFFIEPQIKLASLVGTYTKSDNSSTMQLNNDGTVFVQPSANTPFVQGTWESVNENTIQVSFAVLGTPITVQYAVNGNQLVSTSDSNEVFVKNSTYNNSIVTQAPVQ